MRRRALLSTIAAGGLAAVAGCIGGSTGSGGTPSVTDVDDDGGTLDTIDDVDCPSFADRADRTNCYRQIDRGDASVFVEPSTFTFEDHADDGEVQTVRFTLHNDAGVPFRFNPNAWAVYRFRDDGWTRVAPDGADSLAATLDSGETVEWSLSTEPHPSPGDDVRRITADLDSGHTHAFRVVGDLQEGDGVRIEAVAVFDYVRSVP